jgi:hypothetical protein
MLVVVGTVLHAYVVLRAASVPWIARRVSLPARVAVAAGLWLVYLGASLVGHDAGGPIGRPLALFGVTWLTALLLVARRYPLLQGRHALAGMTVIVPRGTGTWGPRMRLWRPGEIVRVTLRAAAG